MDIYICVGSQCHRNGAYTVIHRLQKLITAQGYGDSINLIGTVSNGRQDSQRNHSVSVWIEEEKFSILPDDTEKWFREEVAPRSFAQQ